MAIATELGRHSSLQVAVRTVTPLQPFAWLVRGWQDLRRYGVASVAYGALMAAAGWVLLLVGSTHPYFIAAAISGFLLVGPLLATGVCELSRRGEMREPASFDDSLDAWSRNHSALMEFGVVLAVISVLWFIVSEILLRSFLHSAAPEINVVLNGGFLHAASGSQLLAYLGIGGALAVLAFVLSAVSIPLIIDRHASASDAMRTSLRVVFANVPAMLCWGLLLVGLTAIGFATALIAMIWIAPLLGHATWHAYRDLVER
jgi:uncharacterized membrane protein